MKTKLLTTTCLLLLSFNFLCHLNAQIGIRDSTDLEAFLDGIIEGNMDARHIAGVTVSVVKNNRLYFSKGYGFADIKKKLKVDPDKSLFKIGSVSKLFVWTAIMQLVEQGKVDLETDINQYLNHFQVPETYEKPITLKHLMTHSAGFEDYVLNLFSSDSLPPVSLESIFQEEMPTRVRPPGIFSSYSNHGTGIAAYIVEQISGLKWDDYVEQRIFAPLGMKKTSFRQPLPGHLETRLSKGYAYGDGNYTAQRLKIIPLAPVGAASTTANDIVPFMIAHLQNGQYENGQILDSLTVEQMHSPLFQHASGINGFCYGFFDHSQNGHKIIGHGGATEFFFSMLLLYPNQGAGIFISTNSADGTGLVRNVTNEFTDRYFPTNGKPKTISFSKKYLEQFVGTYLSNRRPHKRFTKIAALLFEDKKVRVTDDGQLQISGNPAITWSPIDSLTFMDLGSDQKIAFRADEKGKIKYLFSSSSPHIVMERTPTLLSKSLHSKLFLAAFGTILLAYFLWIINHIFKWYYKITDNKDLPAAAKKLALVNGLFIFAFLIGFSILSGDNDLVFRKRNAGDYVLLSLPLISLLLTVWQLIKMIGVWKLNDVRIRSRVFYSLVTLAFMALMWQFYFWNLLGFHF